MTGISGERRRKYFGPPFLSRIGFLLLIRLMYDASSWCKVKGERNRPWPCGPLNVVASERWIMNELEPLDVSGLDLPGVSAEELERVVQPLELAWTMSPAIYTSAKIYALEEKRVLLRSWIPVARADQVSSPGDYLTLTLFDQPLMVVHGQDGEIRVMSRVCLHRAAPIAEGSGNCKRFVCPYHLWSYDSDGRLARAPRMDGCEKFNVEDSRLPQIRTEIWNGFILANFDGDARPLAPQIETFSKFLANYGIGDTVIIDTLEFDSRWNWKILVENFMEAYHHIGSHSKTLEPIFHARDSIVPDSDGPYSILHMPASMKHDARPTFPVFDGLDDWQERDLLATVIFPFFLIAVQHDLVIWYQVLPRGCDRLLLKIHICVHKSALDLPDLDERRKQTRARVNFVHGEDITANDLVWQGLHAPLTGQGRLSLLEKSIWQFNNWWLRQMAQPA
jgi:phenylpropionate dioxygenase-like ring-hydroxylating dioxygenase large terminal subunit